MENLVNEMKELLLNNNELLSSVVSELNCWNGCLDHLEVFTNDEEFFELFFNGNGYELARAIHFGDYNFNDDYVKFNGYGNLESLSEYDYIELLEENVDDIIELLIENYCHINIYDSELNDLLERLEEEEIA